MGHVHRLVLSMASKFFERMFESDMKEARCKEVELKNIELETLKPLLIYMYKDEIDDKDLADVWLVAYQHSIKSLTHDALVYMAKRWNVLCTNEVIVKLIEQFPN